MRTSWDPLNRGPPEKWGAKSDFFSHKRPEVPLDSVAGYARNKGSVEVHSCGRRRGETGNQCLIKDIFYIDFFCSGYRVYLFKRQHVAGTTVPLVGSLFHSRRMRTIRRVVRNRAVQYEGLSEQDTPDTGQGGAPGTGFRVSHGMLN